MRTHGALVMASGDGRVRLALAVVKTEKDLRNTFHDDGAASSSCGDGFAAAVCARDEATWSYEIGLVRSLFQRGTRASSPSVVAMGM